MWSCIDYYAKLQPALPLPRPWRDEGRQIKKAILEVLYGQRCDGEASRVKEDSTLAELFRNELQGGDILVSFNYDTIAERLAQRLKRQLRAVPFGCADDEIRFAKPHGSTSWTLDPRSSPAVIWTSLDGSLFLESLSSHDVDCGREPLVLGAVPIKSELIREVQASTGTPAVFDAVSVQWRAVVEAVRDADTIVVVGYSFPIEDQYGRFLVREGLRLRLHRNVRIEFFDLENNEADRSREIVDVFHGYIRELVFRGRVKSGATA